MEADLCFGSEAGCEVVIGESTNAVQPLPAIIRVEIGERATNIQLLVAAFSGCHYLGSTYRREK
jgi:hypothetical protein